MTTLSSLLPPFLRRKRSAEEDEAHALRAALNAAGRATAVEKCLDLHAANKALAQRIGELERAVAARDDAAVRETVRDEVARIAPLPPPFCAAKDSKGSGLEGLLKSEAPSSNTPQPPQLAPPPNANHLLGLSPEELRSYCDDNNINSVAAISSHEPEIAAWRSDAPERKQSVRPDASKRVSVSFFNLRQAPIEVMWVDFDGNDKPLYTSTAAPGQCVQYTTPALHFWRVYDAADRTLLGAAYIKLPKPGAFDGWTWRPEPARQLRNLFGFDGFVGPSLRDAAAAFDGAAEVRAKTTALTDYQVIIVV